MIPVSEEVLDEVDIVGGKAALIEITLWGKPFKSEKKYRIAAANSNWDLICNYDYDSKDEAYDHFNDLCSKT